MEPQRTKRRKFYASHVHSCALRRRSAWTTHQLHHRPSPLITAHRLGKSLRRACASVIVASKMTPRPAHGAPCAAGEPGLLGPASLASLLLILQAAAAIVLRPSSVLTPVHESIAYRPVRKVTRLRAVCRPPETGLSRSTCRWRDSGRSP
jgi:hypothetical protein